MINHPPEKLLTQPLKTVKNLVQEMVQKMVQKIVQKMVQGSNGPVHILPYALSQDSPH